MIMKIKPIDKLQTEIAGYGFTYSLKKVYVTMLIFFVGILITGFLFKLQMSYILILGGIGILMLPMIIISQYKYLFEQRRFTDVSTYVEQMIYNFKKQPKILNALIEVKRMFVNDGKSQMASTLEKAIKSIQEDGADYTGALSSIYEQYPCSRVKSLHRFMMKIERNGGLYQSGINVLLEDIGIWIERTYQYQVNRKHAKNNILISIILSCVICYFMIYALTGGAITFGSGVYNNQVFQVALCIFLAISLTIYTISTSKLNGSWLVKENSDDSVIKQKYDFINTYDAKVQRKKALIKLAILSPLALLATLLIQNWYILSLLVVMMAIIYTQPAKKLKSATKYIEREVSKAFGDWLRDLMIDIPLSNVRVALRTSLADAPYVLQGELAKLIANIDKDSISSIPYQQFFKDYALPEIKRPVQMLYSLNELGKDEVEKQLNDLIKQNNALIARSEDLRNEDAVTLTNAIVAGPMITSSLVLLVIMFLFFVVAIGSMASQVM